MYSSIKANWTYLQTLCCRLISSDRLKCVTNRFEHRSTRFQPLFVLVKIWSCVKIRSLVTSGTRTLWTYIRRTWSHRYMIRDRSKGTRLFQRNGNDNISRLTATKSPVNDVIEWLSGSVSGERPTFHRDRFYLAILCIPKSGSRT